MVHQFTTGFNEYEAVFIYLSDILMLGFLASFFWGFGWRQFSEQRKPALLKIFLALTLVSVFLALSREIAIYNLVRLVLLVIAALAAAKLLKMGIVKFENILAILAASAVVQSLIGIGQFIKQESLGLARLGEPLIGPNVGGAAKIIAEGGKVLRAYGTLPHPNVLAAFLVIGLLAMYYFWLNRPSEWKVWSGWRTLASDAFSGIGIFIIILGLTLAFSRAAWIVADLATLAILFHAFVVKKNWIQAIRLSVLLVAVAIILFIGFGNFILPRAQINPSEPAVTQRLGYNDIAVTLIKNNFLGVGIGNQVLYSVKNGVYKNAGMNQVWQWQPIHNIYLLIAAEIGVLSLLAFLLFIGKLLFSKGNFLAATMLCSLLALGLFDHFLWTLQPGRLMLWLVIGIVLAHKRS